MYERYRLVHTPSANLWTRPAPRPGEDGRVLALAPSTTACLPLRDEVARIREVYGRRALRYRCRRGERRFARKRHARTSCTSRTSACLTSHNPLFSYVELAAGPGSDGRLEVHEVFDLELAGSWSC